MIQVEVKQEEKADANMETEPVEMDSWKFGNLIRQTECYVRITHEQRGEELTAMWTKE